MKKRLLVMTIMLVVALSFTGNKAYALEKSLTEQEKSTAVNADMGKDYTVTWKDGLDYAVNKITLAKKGILAITASKVKSNSLGYVHMRVSVYDANGDIVWECTDMDENNTNPTMYVGLNAGTYYVLVESQYSVWDATTTYRFGFTENQYVEAEGNNTKETATPLTTDITYTGWLGSGFGEINGFDDGRDVYKVKLVKGKKYRLVL